MKEVINDIDQWLAAGETNIILATVIETWGSAPRKVGAKMAFTAGGEFIAGSVSGGCVEGAVIAAGEAVLAGRPQLLHFGVADETAWGVGLACGGTITVFVERLDASLYPVMRHAVVAHQLLAIATIVRGPDELIGRKIISGTEQSGRTHDERLDHQVAELARKAHRSHRFLLANGVELFVDVLRPAPAMVVVGGAHIAVALVRMARVLGYRTTVIDPRRAFGSETRFPEVDRLIQAWPDKAFANHPITSDSAVVTLSHDPKIDDPALSAALASEAFYIGALGSRQTHAKRRVRLARLGFDEAQLDRIHGPVGLDIGADNPEEIALAIMAQVVATYRAGDHDSAESAPAGD